MTSIGPVLHRAVFLDRDGTIAKDVHYCRRPEDFHILPRVPQAIRLLNQHGFKVVVITNQSGIARSYFTEETLSRIHDRMKSDLQRDGASIDAIYVCPHHPDEGCECRKPKPLLLIEGSKRDRHYTGSVLHGGRRSQGCSSWQGCRMPDDLVDSRPCTASRLKSSQPPCCCRPLRSGRMASERCLKRVRSSNTIDKPSRTV